MIFWKFIEAKDSHITITIYFKIEEKVINIFSSFPKCVLVISILFFHIVKDVASRAACIHTRDAYCMNQSLVRIRASDLTRQMGAQLLRSVRKNFRHEMFREIGREFKT